MTIIPTDSAGGIDVSALEDALDDAGEAQAIANEFALWPGAFLEQKEYALSERGNVQMMSRISTVFICRNARRECAHSRLHEQDLYSHCANRECARDEQDLYSLLEANRKDDGESQRCSQSQGIVVLLLTRSDSEQTRGKSPAKCRRVCGIYPSLMRAKEKDETWMACGDGGCRARAAVVLTT